MINSIRAALFADRKRPAVWSIAGTWLVLALVFGLGVPYIVYLALSGNPEEAESAGELLATVLPGKLVPTVIALFPLFGGAIVVVLGAVLIGNEYRWGTLHLIFTQRPSRVAVLTGHAIALLVITFLLVLATFLVMGLAMGMLAVVEGQPANWPTVGQLIRAVGAAWLICAAQAGLGFFLAILCRSTATAIAIGLVWTMIIENAVSGLALVLAPFEILQKVLLAPSAGALAGALGARSQFAGGTPGVVEATNGWLPTLVLLGYVIVMIGTGLWVTARRDVN